MKELCNYCSHQKEYVAEEILNARTCYKKDCVNYSEYGSRSYFIVASYSAAIEDVMTKIETLEAKVSALQYQLDTGEKPE